VSGDQPGLPGFALCCGWNHCTEDALCGLRHRGDGTVVNTCRGHFRDHKGREFGPEDERAIAAEKGGVDATQ